MTEQQSSGALDDVRLWLRTPPKDPHVVVFDFKNDWHCAVQVNPGASKSKVADELERVAHLIRSQAERESRRDQNVNMLCPFEGY